MKKLLDRSRRVIHRVVDEFVAKLRYDVKELSYDIKDRRITRLRTFMTETAATLPSDAPNLVLGLALGYSADAVRPFVESLLTAGAFRGRAVLFVRRQDANLAAYLRSRGIITVVFDAKAYPVANLAMARFFAYFDYLRSCLERGESYRCVLLTDVRDVIFQKPLFGVPCGQLEFHYEGDGSHRIGKNRANSTWIRQCFGSDVLAQFAELRPSCSGTVCGGMREILHYLAQMQRLMLVLPILARRTLGADQGVHNYVVHNCLVPEAKILDNLKRVATLARVNGADLHLNEDGLIVNPDGTISEIVHHWNRHPHLAAAILKQYLLACTV